MERVKAHPYSAGLAGALVALLAAKGVRKFIESRKQFILELDLQHKEFTYRSLTGNRLATLLNPKMLSIEDIVATLDLAAADKRVVALVCRVGPVPGLASAHDLRAAVSRLRAAGKLTIAYSESLYDRANDAYFLATAFERVYLSRSGILALRGPGYDMPFVKGTLEKCGIRARLLQREEYKNFANTLQEEKLSDAHREVSESLLEEIFSVQVAAAADRKGVSKEEMEESYLRGPFTPQAAVGEGLIDGLKYRDEIYADVKEQFPKAKLLYSSKYLLAQKKRPFSKGKHKVAYIEATGNIHDGPAQQDITGARQSIGSDTTCADIRAAIADKSVKAIIFRVDSGGGSYSASDAINRELQRAQKEGKPVIAWMGNVAGSGGYVVSMSADKIVAQPMTLTGSIGVIMGKFMMRETGNILGLTFDRVDIRDHGERGTLLSSLYDYSEEQLEKLNVLTDHVYEEFKTDAATGRKMPKEAMDELAKGRVWSGRQALDNKLVDALGDIHVVMGQLKLVCKWGEKDTVQLVRFPNTSLLARLKKPVSSQDADEKGVVATCTQGFVVRCTNTVVAALFANNPFLQTLCKQVFSSGLAGPAGSMTLTATMPAQGPSL